MYVSQKRLISTDIQTSIKMIKKIYFLCYNLIQWCPLSICHGYFEEYLFHHSIKTQPLQWLDSSKKYNIWWLSHWFDICYQLQNHSLDKGYLLSEMRTKAKWRKLENQSYKSVQSRICEHKTISNWNTNWSSQSEMNYAKIKPFCYWINRIWKTGYLSITIFKILSRFTAKSSTKISYCTIGDIWWYNRYIKRGENQGSTALILHHTQKNKITFVCLNLYNTMRSWWNQKFPIKILT